MRVTCQTVEEFLSDIRAQIEGNGEKCQAREEDGCIVYSEAADCVLQRAIRISVFRRPSDDGVKFDIVLQASAILALAGGGEYLLQLGVNCGTDYEDVSQEKEGSDKVAELKKEIEVFCEAMGLTIRPGMIEP